MNLYDPLLDPAETIAQKWGPGSSAAVDGDQRYFPVLLPAVDGANRVNGQFFSPRLGCLVFPSFGYGVDLAALCVNPSS